MLRKLLFQVHNELGRFCNEQQCGDRFEALLKENRVSYEREKILPMSFVGEHRGRNRVDFLISYLGGRIVVELKCKPCLSKNEYFQCQRYLVALQTDLCLLVNFRTKYLTVQRILNHQQYRRTQ